MTPSARRVAATRNSTDAPTVTGEEGTAQSGESVLRKEWNIALNTVVTAEKKWSTRPEQRLSSAV